MHKRLIGRLSRQKCFWRQRTYALKMSVNGASTILGLASSLIKGPCSEIDLYSHYWRPLLAKMLSTPSYLCPKNERQRSVNEFRPSNFVNVGAVRRPWCIIDLSAAFLGNNTFHNIVTVPKEWASTERQRFQALHLWISRGCETTLIYDWTIGRVSGQQCLRRLRHYALKMSVNGASTILCLASWNNKGLCDYLDP